MTQAFDLTTADSASAAIPSGATCDHCGKPFVPRSGSGGRPQRFCGETCKGDYWRTHRGQRAPTCVEKTSSASIAPAPASDHRTDDDLEEFSWSEDTGSILLQEQLTTAAYINAGGGLTIRQCNWPDGDVLIVIQPANIMAFIDRLCDVVGIGAARP